MKCPVCEKCGEENLSYQSGGATTTLAYTFPFRDEDGRLHDHDINAVRHTCKCSEGHMFYVTTYGSCWCGWSGGETKVEF